MLVHVLVGYDPPLHFGSRVVAIVAAGALLACVVDEAIGEHALHAVALDLAGRKDVIGDQRRRFTQHRRHLMRLDLATRERAVLAQLPDRGSAQPMTEIILAAGIELKIRW